MERLSNIFWGLILVFFGILSLLENFDLLAVDWWSLLQLWPLIIVYFGLLFFPAKARVIGVIGLFVIIAGFTFYHLSWQLEEGANEPAFEAPERNEKPGAESSDLTLPYDSAYKVGRLNVEGGPGKFHIQGTTTDHMAVISGHQGAGWGALNLKHQLKGDTFTINSAITKGNFPESGDPLRFLLNPDPVWHMDFEVGASRANFNLAPLKVKRLSIDAGASSVKLRLGDRYEQTKVTLESGVSSIKLKIPESSGCRVESTADLSDLDFEGFHKLEEGKWESKGFKNAENQILLNIQGGLSHLKVERE